MTDTLQFTPEERQQITVLYTELKRKIAPTLADGDEERLRSQLLMALDEGRVQRDLFGLNPIVSSLQTALLVVDEIGLRRDAVLAVMLYPCLMQCSETSLTIEEVSATYGSAVGRILHGLQRGRIQAVFLAPYRCSLYGCHFRCLDRTVAVSGRDARGGGPHRPVVHQ